MIQVFGGHGYIGSNFCALGEYEDLNKRYIVNDRNDYTVHPLATEIVYFISTVSNYNVLHDPQIDIDTNLKILMLVLDQCRNELGDRNITFNFISSWFVLGDTELPANEDSVCNPKGFYSITKRAAEQLLISYCETFNIKYRILRLANVVGGERKDRKASKQKNALMYLLNEIK